MHVLPRHRRRTQPLATPATTFFRTFLGTGPKHLVAIFGWQSEQGKWRDQRRTKSLNGIVTELVNALYFSGLDRSWLLNCLER